MNVKTLLIVCMAWVSVTAFAQQKVQVSGVVTDASKEPLIGVNVTVKDQPGLGAITDMNGRYTIQVEEFSRLEFSYVGFEKKEVLIKRQKEVNVVLKEATTSEIDEVIVTGTGAQKKLTVTGAVTNVDVDVLKSKALVNYTVANLIL